MADEFDFLLEGDEDNTSDFLTEDAGIVEALSEEELGLKSYMTILSEEDVTGTTEPQSISGKIQMLREGKEDIMRGKILTEKHNLVRETAFRAAQESISTGKDLEEIELIMKGPEFWDMEDRRKTILETSSAAQAVNEGALDPVREAIIQDNVDNTTPDKPTVDDILEQSLATSLLTRQEFLKHQKAVAEDTFIGTSVEVLESMIPLQNNLVFRNAIEEVMGEDGIKFSDLGSSLEGLKAYLDTRTPEQWLKAADRLNKGIDDASFQDNALMKASLWAYMDSFPPTSKGAENFFEAMEALGIAAPIANAVKSVGMAIKTGIVATKIAAGNRHGAVKSAAEALDRLGDGVAASGKIGDDIAENAVLSGTATPRANPAVHNLSVAEQERANYKILQELDQEAKNFDETLSTLALGEEAATQATEAAVDALRLELNIPGGVGTEINEAVDMVNIIPTTNEGIPGIRAFIGPNKETGYVSEDIALHAIKARKIRNAHVEKNGEYFYIVVDRDGDLTKVTAIEETASETRTGIGGVKSWVFGADTILGNMQRQIKSLVGAGQAKGLHHSKQILKPINDLSKEEGIRVKNALAQTQQRAEFDGKNEWFTVDELKYKDNLRLTDKEIKAYKAVQLAEDIYWQTNNAKRVFDLARQGFKNISVSGNFGKKTEEGVTLTRLKNINGKPIELENINLGNKPVYNAIDGEFMDVGTIPATTLQKWKDTGVKVIKLEEEVRFNGKHSRYIIAKSDDIEVSDLSRFQLTYLAGGRRYYTDDLIYLKQAITRTTADGSTYMTRPVTLAAAHSRSEAIAYQDAWNSAIQSFKKYGKKDSPDYNPTLATKEISKVTAGYGDIASVDEFEKLIWSKNNPDGFLNLDNPVEFARSGADIPSVSKARALNSGIMFDEESLSNTNSIDDLINMRSKGVFGKRGTRLRNIDGISEAPILDPFESAARSLSRANKLKILEPYRRRIVDNWVREFGSLLDTDLTKTWALDDIFATPVYRKNLSLSEKELVNKAQAQRRITLNMLNQPTKEEEFIRQVGEQVANRFDLKAGTWLSKISHKTDPVGFLRSVAFHSKLGLGAFDQILVQSQAIPVMLAASPKHGMKGVAKYIPLRIAMMSDEPKHIEAVAKAFKLDVKEFNELHKSLNKSGYNRIQGTLTEQHFSHDIGNGGAYLNKALELGSMPFTGTERANSIIAYATAWGEWTAKNVGKSSTTREAIQEILNRADTLQNNMRRQGNSIFLQKGVAGLTTQFAFYPLRLAENLLPKALGGGTGLRWDEKIRVSLGVLALYGAGGTFSTESGMAFTGWVQEQWRNATGNDMPEEMAKLVMYGIIDRMILSPIAGKDTTSSTRLGPQEFNNIYVKAFTEKTTFTEFLAGISGSTFESVGGFTGALVDIGRLHMLDDVKSATKFAASFDIANKWASETFKGWGNLTKAYYAMNTGKIINRKGVAVAQDLNKFQSVLTTAGFKYVDEVDSIVLNRMDSLRKQAIKDITESLVPAYLEAMRQGTSEAGEVWEARKRAVLTGVEEELHSEVMWSVYKKSGLDFTDMNTMTKMMRVSGHDLNKIRDLQDLLGGE